MKTFVVDGIQAHPQEGTEGLTVHGYEVIPEYFEDDRGTWEPPVKAPSHILTAYDVRDPAKTLLIAKRVRKRSKEMKILRYLNGLQPTSPHIISLICFIQTASETWAIRPRHYSIHIYLTLFGSGGFLRDKLVLGHDLIQGLAYLHKHGIAHLDVKPENLVDGNSQL